MVVSGALLGVVVIGGGSYVFDRLLLLHGFEVGGAASHTAHAWHTGERHFGYVVGRMVVGSGRE